jgi:hypothetical protein
MPWALQCRNANVYGGATSFPCFCKPHHTRAVAKVRCKKGRCVNERALFEKSPATDACTICRKQVCINSQIVVVKPCRCFSSSRQDPHGCILLTQACQRTEMLRLRNSTHGEALVSVLAAHEWVENSHSSCMGPLVQAAQCALWMMWWLETFIGSTATH